MKSHNTLLKKIILLFISIFIPLTTISLITIVKSNHKLQNQVLSSIDSNNLNYISQLNTALDNIYINSYNLINQSNFKNFSNTYTNFSSYEKRTQVKLIQEQLSGLKISSPFIESAHAYFLDSAIAFHSHGYMYGSFHRLSSEDVQTFHKIAESEKFSHYFQNPITEKPSFDFFITPENSDAYVAGITISQHEIEKYLAANSAYKNEGFLFSSDSVVEINRLPDEIKDDAITIRKQIEENHNINTFFQATLDGTNYYVFFYEIPSLSAQYIRLIPTSSLLKNIHTAPILIILFFLFVFGACILFFICVYRLIHKPLHQFTNAFEELEKGNFSVTIDDTSNADFAYLFRSFNTMTSKLNRLIEQDYNQKMLLQKAELKQLQAQINPHFLYNSFFMLQRMIKMELSDESQEMASALGKYFRYLTRNNMDNVTLETEYEHAKTYAYIQGLRFTGRIQIEFEDLPAEYKNLPVPKLILQPLLENAFNYGLNNKMENGLLKIHFLHSGDSLTIIVEDNGEELTDELLQSLENKLNTAKETSTDYEMTGLLNIQRRLAIFSDYTYSLNVTRSDMGGLCVSICLRK